MADFPYFPFYPADWISSPRIMCSTLVQQGAYIRLLCICWLSGDCSLPDNDELLCKLGTCSEQDIAFVRQVFTKHPTKEGALTNERLHKEWEKVTRISDARSKAGVKSGKSRRNKCSTNVQQVLNKRRTIASISESESESYSQSEVITQNQSHKEKEILSTSASPRGTGKSVETWNAYAAEYHRRYHVLPVRNQQTNSQLARVVDRLGSQEAPLVAQFYVRLNDPLYVKARHPTNLFLRDCEGIRTQWASGVKATQGEARNAAVVDEVVEQVKRVEALIARRNV